MGDISQQGAPVNADKTAMLDEYLEKLNSYVPKQQGDDGVMLSAFEGGAEEMVALCQQLGVTHLLQQWKVCCQPPPGGQATDKPSACSFRCIS